MDELERAKRVLGINFELKKEQNDAIRAFMDKRDIVCLLPTGFGKSIIFQLMPFVVDDPNAVSIVISPLNAIMKDQVKKLCDNGVPACFLDMTGRDGTTYKLRRAQCDLDSADLSDNDTDGGNQGEDDDEDIDDDGLLQVSIRDVAHGHYKLIYAHPEAFLSSKEGRKILQSQFLREHLCSICIDEAHMIHEWGEEFRKDFSRIQEILGVFPNVPVSLFTATASPSTRDKLVKDLGLRNPLHITKNPDRPNIKYLRLERLPSVKQEDDLDEILGSIADSLLSDKKNYPVTIIYSDLETIRYGYRFLEAKIGEDIPEKRCYAQFHTHYTERMKNWLISDLGKQEPVTRVVLATVALGIGLHAPAVRRVIHFKCPTNIEKYIQETGRAGRDGKPATAVLYWNRTDVRSNRPGLQNAMKVYCTSKDICLRVQLLSHLDFEPEVPITKCKCCSVCEQSCKCSECEK